MSFSDIPISKAPKPKLLNVNDSWVLTTHDRVKKKMYRKLNEELQSKPYISYTGPLVGGVSGFMTVASRLAAVVEKTIKGFIHLGGCAFSPSCKLAKGLELVFITPILGAIWIPVSVLSEIIGIAGKTFGLLMEPEKYLFTKEMLHEPNAMLLGINYANGTDRDELKAVQCYRAASALTVHIPRKTTRREHAKALLAGMYLAGRGVRQSDEKGFSLLKDFKRKDIAMLEQLAINNHVPEAAMALFALYASDNNASDALRFLSMAAENGDHYMKRHVASRFEIGIVIGDREYKDLTSTQRLRDAADLLDPPRTPPPPPP